MERLLEKIAMAEKALGKLAEAADIEKPSELERDATIQRFEFSFEAVWKAAQAYLRVVEGLDIASPKGVIRSCRELGLLTEAETAQCLKMADDRNLTVHTYNEPLALAIYERILGYRHLLFKWQQAMRARVEAMREDRTREPEGARSSERGVNKSRGRI